MIRVKKTPEQLREYQRQWRAAHPESNQRMAAQRKQARLMADNPFDRTPMSKGKIPEDQLCSCGCGERHNLAVSRTQRVEGDNRYTHKIWWYRSMACRNKHVGVSDA